MVPMFVCHVVFLVSHLGTDARRCQFRSNGAESHCRKTRINSNEKVIFAFAFDNNVCVFAKAYNDLEHGAQVDPTDDTTTTARTHRTKRKNNHDLH